MSATEPTIWLARAGERGFALTDCVKADVVALRYPAVGDASSLTLAQITETLAEDASPTKATTVAGTLFRFVHDVNPGDVVVTTHLDSRSIYFGEVTGDYRFADPSPVPDFSHLRPVDWFGTLSRDTDVPTKRRSDIDKQPTFYELADQEYWSERAEAARTGTSEVRPPLRTAPPKDATAGGVEVATPTQVCTSCGLRKASGIITDGVCRDCD